MRTGSNLFMLSNGKENLSLQNIMNSNASKCVTTKFVLNLFSLKCRCEWGQLFFCEAYRASCMVCVQQMGKCVWFSVQNTLQIAKHVLTFHWNLNKQAFFQVKLSFPSIYFTFLKMKKNSKKFYSDVSDHTVIL